MQEERRFDLSTGYIWFVNWLMWWNWLLHISDRIPTACYCCKSLNNISTMQEERRFDRSTGWPNCKSSWTTSYLFDLSTVYVMKLTTTHCQPVCVMKSTATVQISDRIPTAFIYCYYLLHEQHLNHAEREKICYINWLYLTRLGDQWPFFYFDACT
jgi:hypothetical protein